MFKPDVWGRSVFRRLKPKNDNDLEPNWLNAKALYDEAHEHLRLYETLYAQAHAIDMACRQAYAKGRQS
ncbi:MAG: hypothetical protein AAF569_04845 [Pseudomonadota bacterium]